MHEGLLNDLYMVKATTLTRDACREPRRAPFSLLIAGDSGIGKSTIIEMLYIHACAVMKLDNSPTFKYTKHPTAKYWDGFTTSCHTIVLDDVAFMNPKCAPNGDPTVMEFLQIINSVPFVPDQADLADKGRTPLRPRLVIATTNTPNLNAHCYFSHPSAA
jgi:hypothetical protein